MPMRTFRKEDTYSRGEESFCLLLRELPDVDDHAIPHNGRNSAHTVLPRRFAADVTAAAALDDCTAALMLANGRAGGLSSAAAERAIRREDLEGGHREWGEEIEKKDRYICCGGQHKRRQYFFAWASRSLKNRPAVEALTEYSRSLPFSFTVTKLHCRRRRRWCEAAVWRKPLLPIICDTFSGPFRSWSMIPKRCGLQMVLSSSRCAGDNISVEYHINNISCNSRCARSHVVLRWRKAKCFAGVTYGRQTEQGSIRTTAENTLKLPKTAGRRRGAAAAGAPNFSRRSRRC